MTNFNEFGLAAPILKALTAEGYVTPTPIQTQAIPHVMAGKDLQGIAQTGTGKTAAFALPILHRLAANPRRAAPQTSRVLVLSPTRELASQIAESFKAYGRHMNLSTAVVFGGVSIRPQIAALSRGVDILVATPGRLIDHLDSRTLRLDGVEIFVLDEADQMLDMGFIHAIRRIVPKLPKVRQSLFFSATMPRDIATLAGDLLHDPMKVAVAPVATTVEKVEQSVILVETARKRALLASLLADPKLERTLVFTRTKHGADRVVKHLDGARIGAAAIHGNKSQNQRERALDDFKAGRVNVLVATDIAARGIDIDAVSHVVNFDLPNVPESYVHRIGRTARAGAGGIAISFCDNEERAFLRDIEKLIRMRIPSSAADVADLPREAAEPRRPQPSAGQRQQRPQGQHRPHGQQRSDRQHRSDGQHRAQGEQRSPDQQRAPGHFHGMPGGRDAHHGRNQGGGRPGQPRQGAAPQGKRPQRQRYRQGPGGR